MAITCAREWVIYALSGPDARVRYVGLTLQKVSTRLSQHRSNARYRPHALPVYRWLRLLLRDGVQPTVAILDRAATLEEASTKERHWIATYRATCHDLLNLADGGYQRPRITAAGRESFSRKMKNRVFTPEHRARISEAKTGKPRPDREKLTERLRQMAKARIGKKMNLSEEGRAQRRANGHAAKGNLRKWNNLNQAEKEARRAAARLQMQRVWASRSKAQQEAIHLKAAGTRKWRQRANNAPE